MQQLKEKVYNFKISLLKWKPGAHLHAERNPPAIQRSLPLCIFSVSDGGQNSVPILCKNALQSLSEVNMKLEQSEQGKRSEYFPVGLQLKDI